MNETAAYALALVLIGGPLAMLAPFVIARRLVDQHGDQVADNVAHFPHLDTTPATTRKEHSHR
ncbi:hypothetical protein C7C45_04800 [Micromonospora arborensis]|uniref:Uncharacterized protein n=1 Tax=Micromonospora arborensis TaxID=2116518 RepID=A0A318NR70_9ACTN|nr:hypothetical protein [Micromonospora arborensis]PYC75191.1 hypothetical protein C7C45_04800 [Micromonospora arborensis]